MDSESQWVYERMKLHHLLQTQPQWSNRQYARTLGHDTNSRFDVYINGSLWQSFDGYA
jgi:hypothetical protein